MVTLGKNELVLIMNVLLVCLPTACMRFVLSKKIDIITVIMVIIIVIIMTMTRIMITSKINRNRRPTIAIFFNLLLLSLHGVWLKYIPLLTVSFIPSVHEIDE